MGEDPDGVVSEPVGVTLVDSKDEPDEVVSEPVGVTLVDSREDPDGVVSEPDGVTLVDSKDEPDGVVTGDVLVVSPLVDVEGVIEVLSKEEPLKVSGVEDGDLLPGVVVSIF
ncbi:unnamed protein product [Ambrosiozyma monospora]|uniref:Unnamed protein product n=1 Tax=Ambrosiozyma monospora TaxID=43982 RepID=A0A9W6T584_AMBMO|nr:unnamed protein product [Ambrosiozyma monospora]